MDESDDCEAANDERFAFRIYSVWPHDEVWNANEIIVSLGKLHVRPTRPNQPNIQNETNEMREFQRCLRRMCKMKHTLFWNWRESQRQVSAILSVSRKKAKYVSNFLNINWTNCVYRNETKKKCNVHRVVDEYSCVSVIAKKDEKKIWKTKTNVFGHKKIEWRVGRSHTPNEAIKRR